MTREALEIEVFTKDNCGDCIRTKKALNAKQIPHSTVHVATDDLETIAGLQDVAEQMGVAPSMPFVRVTNMTTGETEQWFGHRPDLIVQYITTQRRK